MATSNAHRTLPCSQLLLAGLAILTLAVAQPASATEDHAGAGVAKEAPKKNPAKPFPISGNVSAGTTVGIGTFVDGPQRRPSMSGSLSLTVRTAPATGWTLMVMQDISKTLIDNADDGAASRARETFVSDPVAMVLWAPTTGGGGGEKKEMTEAERKQAALNPMMSHSGSGKPLALPGDIRVNFAGIFSLGTSRVSRFQGNYGTAGLAVNLVRSFGPVMLAYRLRFSKNFHEYSNASVDTSGLTSTSMLRAGGAEDLGGGMMATPFQNTSYFLRNRLLMSWDISDAWSFQAMLRVTNLFRYYEAPLDEYSSKYAKEGRGRSDTQLGTMSLNYVMGSSLIWSLASTTWSAPWSNDNQSYRFPLWDFVSASDNITTVSLSVTKMF